MNSLTIEELKEYLIIDKHDLDNAVSYQSELLYQVSYAVTLAINAKDLAKKEIDDCYANVSLALRQESIENKLKITEDQIKQNVQTSSEYEIAQLNYLNKKQYSEQLIALKEAFISRGYMIRELCGLWTANYFADSAVKSDNNPSVSEVRYNVARTALVSQRTKIKRESLK